MTSSRALTNVIEQGCLVNIREPVTKVEASKTKHKLVERPIIFGASLNLSRHWLKLKVGLWFASRPNFAQVLTDGRQRSIVIRTGPMSSTIMAHIPSESSPTVQRGL